MIVTYTETEVIEIIGRHVSLERERLWIAFIEGIATGAGFYAVISWLAS